MNYQYYFINSDFEGVWNVLKTYYKEQDEVKALYKALFYTIRNLKIDDKESHKPLVIELDFENKIHVAGAPDPIEWLVGREVIVKLEKSSEENLSFGELSVAEVGAHLLYWSTLYDFKTQTRHNKDCQNSFDSVKDHPRSSPAEKMAKRLSLQRKKVYYWKDALAHDSAIDWSYILEILKKRIEYHIGYHRYTDRFVNSRHYVSRMVLCCRLLELASEDFYDMEGVYVNTRNASRYIGSIFTKYQYDSIDKIDKDDGEKEYILTELRRAKSYKILWKFLDHNLLCWWD